MSTATSPATTATLALKEWAAVAAALLDGRQTVLLRKGGIHEKRFRLVPERADARGGEGFVLFPTVAHSHAERVRPEHAPLLEAGARDVRDDGTFTVRCGLTLVDAVEVTRPAGLGQIADLHIWTADAVRIDRLEFRPKVALQVLVVRAFALPQPLTLERLDAYAGCRSWVDLPLAWDGASGRQVHDDARLAADAARVRAAVASGPQASSAANPTSSSTSPARSAKVSPGSPAASSR